jgi:hypothetical protein
MGHLGKGNPGDLLHQVGQKNIVIGKRLLDTVTVAALPVVADFETLSAAAVNNTVLDVIGDVNEVANVPIGASGLTVRMFNNPTIDMAGNSFLWSANGSLALRGPASIDFTSSPLFDANGNSGRAIVDGMEITTGLAATGILTDGERGRFTGCVFTSGLRLDGIRNTVVGADIGFGIVVDASAENNIISSCQLDADEIVDAGSGTILSDIRIY